MIHAFVLASMIGASAPEKTCTSNAAAQPNSIQCTPQTCEEYVFYVKQSDPLTGVETLIPYSWYPQATAAESHSGRKPASCEDFDAERVSATTLPKTASPAATIVAATPAKTCAIVTNPQTGLRQIEHTAPCVVLVEKTNELTGTPFVTTVSYDEAETIIRVTRSGRNPASFESRDVDGVARAVLVY